MRFRTSDLPGIGKRYSLETFHGQKIVIITHQHGQREIYHFNHADDDDPAFIVELNDEEARQLGAILLGVDYQPVPDEKMELMINSIKVHWFEVKPESCLANQSIAQAQIRKRTGVTVIGIKRGENFIGSPDVEETILPGDILIAIGKRDPVKTLEAMCRGNI